MPGYHFYCLNAEGRFAFGKHIEAEDLNAAIRDGLRKNVERTQPGRSQG